MNIGLISGSIFHLIEMLDAYIVGDNCADFALDHCVGVLDTWETINGD